MAGQRGHRELNSNRVAQQQGPAPRRTAPLMAEQAQPRRAAGQRQYQARWISRHRLNELRRAGGVGDGVLIDHFRGVVIVEPLGSNLGDGELLTPEAADYELRQVWCLTTPRKLADARELLGLEADLASAHEVS